ncbi:hypothetical protein GF345_05300 [Candidatus Woesearchaeota archaeon]|nr:hypothetical protein [Candidatus Woesearchaeota archaeon]
MAERRTNNKREPKFADRASRFSRDSSSRRPKKGSGKLEMHEITCDECGKRSEVPFRPTSSKPIYCSDCFRKHESSSGSKGAGVSAEDIAMINMKLDKIMRALKVN